MWDRYVNHKDVLVHETAYATHLKQSELISHSEFKGLIYHKLQNAMSVVYILFFGLLCTSNARHRNAILMQLKSHAFV